MMKRTAHLLRKYRQRLSELPLPGFGHGFHQKILGVANLGFHAGLRPSEVYDHIRIVATQAQSVGARNLRSEIFQVIAKAYGFESHHERTRKAPKGRTQTKEMRKQQRTPRIPPRRTTPEEQCERRFAIHHGRDVAEETLLQLSPIHIPPPGGPVNEQAITLLANVYDGNDHVFIGGERETFKPGTASRLRVGFRVNAHIGLQLPYILPNVLSGKPGLTKGGKESYRCDACVEHAHIMCVEFDSIPLSEQRAFFAYLPFPIVALIFSGGKSIHAWLSLKSFGADPRGLFFLERGYIEPGAAWNVR